MAIPVFWNTPFYYAESTIATDVNNLIAAVNAAVLALTPAWTDESGVGTGPWRTPVRSDGIFFRVGLTRVSATRLQWQMYDHAGMLIPASSPYLLDIEAGGCPVQIYVGTLHLCVNVARAAQECMWFTVLDQTPDPINLPRPMYMAYQGPRSSDGTLRSYNWQATFAMTPGATVYAVKNWGIYRAANSAYYRRTVNNTSLFAPAEMGDNTYNSNQGIWLGRVQMAIAVDATGLNYGSEITVPIDAGVNGVFKVVGCASYQGQYMAFRKS